MVVTARNRIRRQTVACLRDDEEEEDNETETQDDETQLIETQEIVAQIKAVASAAKAAEDAHAINSGFLSRKPVTEYFLVAICYYV